jgi:hypothetical protein
VFSLPLFILSVNLGARRNFVQLVQLVLNLVYDCDDRISFAALACVCRCQGKVRTALDPSHNGAFAIYRLLSRHPAHERCGSIRSNNSLLVDWPRGRHTTRIPCLAPHCLNALSVFQRLFGFLLVGLSEIGNRMLAIVDNDIASLGDFPNFKAWDKCPANWIIEGFVPFILDESVLEVIDLLPNPHRQYSAPQEQSESHSS